MGWLKKASEAGRLMEDAASAGVTAESEPTMAAEVGVETTLVKVGNGRSNPVTPGGHTVSLPWHLEKQTERYSS